MNYIEYITDDKNRALLTFDSKLAELIGLNEAIILKKLIDLVEFTHTKSICSEYIDGNRYVRLSLNDLKYMFPFLGESTIRRTINNLCGMNLILKEKLSPYPMDNTMYYSINDSEVEKIINMVRVSTKVHTNAYTELCKSSNKVL